MLFWIAGVVLAITLGAAALFFGLHLATNELVPLERARLAWRWSLVVFLGSFDWWIFSRIFGVLRELWF